jgi:hypothetical protein
MITKSIRSSIKYEHSHGEAEYMIVWKISYTVVRISTFKNGSLQQALINSKLYILKFSIITAIHAKKIFL